MDISSFSFFKKIFTTHWQCPSNIAIVKYWGKFPGQYPMNSSMSFTLKNAHTKTKLQVYEIIDSKKFLNDGIFFKSTPPYFSFTLAGKSAPKFHEKIIKLLNYYAEIFKIDLNKYFFELNSINTFPHSAGIASSASGMGALALVLTDFLKSFGHLSQDEDFFHLSSRLARMGSGSACRPLFPYVGLWAHLPDENVCAKTFEIHEVFKTYQNAILIIDSKEKVVGSSDGHKLMDHHIYKEARIRKANLNCDLAKKYLQNGDEKELLDLCEEEALGLHALMMTSKPNYILLHPHSLWAIKKIREFRQKNNVLLGFSIDAGPNIHLLYPKRFEDLIRKFIQDELIQLCHEGTVLFDEVGSGPSHVNTQEL